MMCYDDDGNADSIIKRRRHRREEEEVEEDDKLYRMMMAKDLKVNGKRRNIGKGPDGTNGACAISR